MNLPQAVTPKQTPTRRLWLRPWSSIYFPLIKVKRKLTDPPWFNWKIRKRMAQKKGIHRQEGRSPKWRKVRKLLEDLVEQRRKNYCRSQKDAFMASDGDRNFFKYVRNYKSAEKQKPFNVCTLFPGLSEKPKSMVQGDIFPSLFCCTGIS